MPIHPDRLSRYLVVAGAGIIALALAACDQKISADRVALGDYDATQPTISTALDTDGNAPPAQSKPGGDPVPQKNDLALLIDVKSALLNEPALRSFPIDVGVLRGVVTLYGVVDTPAHREQAAQVAQSVVGVYTVRSGLAVIRAS